MWNISTSYIPGWIVISFWKKTLIAVNGWTLKMLFNWPHFIAFSLKMMHRYLYIFTSDDLNLVGRTILKALWNPVLPPIRNTWNSLPFTFATWEQDLPQMHGNLIPSETFGYTAVALQFTYGQMFLPFYFIFISQVVLKSDVTICENPPSFLLWFFPATNIT